MFSWCKLCTEEHIENFKWQQVDIKFTDDALFSGNFDTSAVFILVGVLTLLLLNRTCPVLANSVDPDQLATDQDLHCLSLNMWISTKNLDQVIWLAGNKKLAWYLNLFSMTRVNYLQGSLLLESLKTERRIKAIIVFIKQGAWPVNGFYGEVLQQWEHFSDWLIYRLINWQCPFL